MSLGVFLKGPDEIVNYAVDWSKWLDTDGDGTVDDTISTVTWELDTGLTEVLATNTTTVATIKVSGGQIGGVYKARCTIVTVTNAETFERYGEIHVVDQ